MGGRVGGLRKGRKKEVETKWMRKSEGEWMKDERKGKKGEEQS